LAAQFGDKVSNAAPASLVASIDRIAYVPRAVLIWKKTTSDFLTCLARWEVLASQGRHNWNWEAIASAILAHNGPLDRAENAARLAVSSRSQTASTYEILARVLERMGNFNGAAESLQTAISMVKMTLVSPPLWRSDGRYF
jgi:hypothetical protein